MHTMSKNTGKTLATVSESETVVVDPKSPIMVEDFASRFSGTFAQFGDVMVQRVAIVTEYLANQPATVKQTPALRALSEAMAGTAKHYSGWKIASLERYAQIGRIVARHGWTADADTIHALYSLVEYNRPAALALETGRKVPTARALPTLERAIESAGRKSGAKGKGSAKEIESTEDTSDTSDAITPEALLASIVERVSAQVWDEAQIGTFAAGLVAYAESLSELVNS